MKGIEVKRQAVYNISEMYINNNDIHEQFDCAMEIHGMTYCNYLPFVMQTCKSTLNSSFKSLT